MRVLAKPSLVRMMPSPEGVMSEFRKKAREKAEAATLRAIKTRGSVEGEAIPRHVRASLLKKELIAEVARLYFGPRAWAYRLTPAGERVAKELGDG